MLSVTSIDRTRATLTPSPSGSDRKNATDVQVPGSSGSPIMERDRLLSSRATAGRSVMLSRQPIF